MDIKINLLNSTDAKHFSPENQHENELVHRREFNRVDEWIDARVRLINDVNNSGGTKKFLRTHDAVSVLGGRGTGKTSFLLTIKEYCLKQKPEIQILDIIDPTLIEEKGHVFLNIISLIKDVVDSQLDTNNCDPRSAEFHRKNVWIQKVESLAHGLPSLDGIGTELTNAEWQDPEYIMQRGIRAVTSARKLEENFNDLITYALEILKKKAFLLILDDIDVSFTKGWPVLETIRKYLTSPHVFTIISGDFKLFSLSVRKQQWKNFGKALLKNEADFGGRRDEYNNIVTELEGQYLKKVLKPERRIHLTTLGEKLLYKGRRDDREPPAEISRGDSPILPKPSPKADGYNIMIQMLSNGEVILRNIRDTYECVFVKFGIKNSYQAEAYRSYFLNLPLRSQIRFLSIFMNSDYSLLRNDISDVFLSELFDKKIQISTFEGREQFLSPTILNLLIQEKKFGETYQLQPTTTDEVLNACLVALNFILSESIKNSPFLIFDYFIKIGYLRNLLSTVGYLDGKQSLNNNLNAAIPSVEGICKHAALLQDRVLRDSAALMLSYMVGVKGTTSKGANQPEGSVQLKGLASLGKRGDSNRIDSVFKQADITQSILIKLPASIASPAHRQSSMVVYSIYTLLGAIAELIRRATEDDLDNGFLELSQIREYSAPNFERSLTDNDDINDIVFDKEDQTENATELKSYAECWIKLFDVDAISPHLLGKISTRMFYAFGNKKSRPQNAGDAMHRMVITFMNAILVEEAKENLKDAANINIDNAIDTDKIFLNNLIKLSSKASELPFSKWMISCPLLLCYLNGEITKNGSFQTFIYPEIYNENRQLSVYKLLSNIDTVYNGQSETMNNELYSLDAIVSNEDLYNYCRNNNIPYDLMMDSKNNDQIYKMFPRFFNVGSKSSKAWNFRKYINGNSLEW
ncbi:hypothetical protein [Taibaiella soli]|uniref:Uncharacterized protein n=1 Tax=Taibaiella soli TaxID=1649169 RepID=A0A2W2BE15_9BACT|nr:hypothetical protein [Taibaiella soli]PZF74127.1 hypothetical protein DN068_03690 [Taibaiella soli]